MSGQMMQPLLPWHSQTGHWLFLMAISQPVHPPTQNPPSYPPRPDHMQLEIDDWKDTLCPLALSICGLDSRHGCLVWGPSSPPKCDFNKDRILQAILPPPPPLACLLAAQGSVTSRSI